MHRVRIPAQINAAGLPRFLTLIGRPVDERIIEIDFSDLRRVSPAALAALTATVRRWQARGRDVRFAGLEECAICGYLQRMDLLRMCSIDHPEHFRRHQARGRFVPLRQISHPVDALGEDIAACVATGGDSYGHPASALYDLVWYVVTETANNARQHSSGTGFATAQMTSHDGFVRLAIGDNGRGILQSFRDAGFAWSGEMDDAAAIAKALEPLVSSKGSPSNAGVGLTLVSRLARLTRGYMLIASGSGLFTLDSRGVFRQSHLHGQSRFAGTLVAVTIPQANVAKFEELLHAAKADAGLLPPDSPRGRFES